MCCFNWEESEIRPLKLLPLTHQEKLAKHTYCFLVYLMFGMSLEVNEQCVKGHPEINGVHFNSLQPQAHVIYSVVLVKLEIVKIYMNLQKLNS